jgi:hypothetical protein
MVVVVGWGGMTLGNFMHCHREIFKYTLSAERRMVSRLRTSSLTLSLRLSSSTCTKRGFWINCRIEIRG